MMQDRELLELAAKAADLKYDPAKTDEIGRSYSDCLGLWIWHWKDWFNPLTDDGDALRLAVEVGMVLHLTSGFVSAEYTEGKRVREVGFNDMGAAARRAIVRAAAEIGAAL